MIGRRPYAAFGNSTGDRQMLEYTWAGDGPRLAMLLLHDDDKREYAYGPAQSLADTKVGTFTQELYDEAKNKGWTVISMKNDWNRIFAFEAAGSRGCNKSAGTLDAQIAAQVMARPIPPRGHLRPPQPRPPPTCPGASAVPRTALRSDEPTALHKVPRLRNVSRFVPGQKRRLLGAVSVPSRWSARP